MEIKFEEYNAKVFKNNVEFKVYGVNLGFFPAEVYTKCGEEIFDEDTSNKIDEVAKQNGLWGFKKRFIYSRK